MKKIRKEKGWKYQDGRFYFSNRAERRALFILTIAMMIAGIMVKMNMV